MTSLATSQFDDALADTTHIGGVLQRVSDDDVVLVEQLTRVFCDALLEELTARNDTTTTVQHRVRGLDASNYYTLEFQHFGTFVPSSVLERFVADNAAHVRDMRVCYPLAITVSLDTLRIEIDVWKHAVDATSRARLALAYRHEVHAPKLAFEVRPRGATRAECDVIRRVIVYVQNMSLDAPSSQTEVALIDEAILISMSNMQLVRVAFIHALRAEFEPRVTFRGITFESSRGAMNELQIEILRDARSSGHKRSAPATTTTTTTTTSNKSKAKSTATSTRQKRAKLRANTPAPSDDDSDDDGDDDNAVSLHSLSPPPPPLPPPPKPAAKSLFSALTSRILGT